MKQVVVVVVILLSGLGGCIGDSDAPGTDDGLIRSFKAVYSSDASSMDQVFELQAPVRILDRDFQHRDAYPLVINPSDKQNHLDQVIYLDEDLRVVRENNWCLTKWVEDECTHATANWERQGALPPMGFFWPRLLAAGGGVLEYSLWLSNLSLELEWIKSPEGHILVMPDDAWPRTGGWLTAPGEHHYRQGMQLPDRVVKEDAVWELESYEEGDALPSADVWPKSTKRPKGAPRDSMMFPGEDEDPYELGSPPLQALEWLLDNNEEAAGFMEQGCVQLYLISIRDAYSPGPLSLSGLSPFHPEHNVYHLFSILSQEGKGKQWTVRHEQDAPPGDGYRITKEEEPLMPPTTACMESATSPAPSMTSVEARELLSTMPVSHQKHDSFNYFFHQMPTGGEGTRLNPPEDGWDVYSLFYVPDHVDTSQMTYGFKPYFIEMAASSQYLTYVKVHPDDLKEIDEDWTPPDQMLRR